MALKLMYITNRLEVALIAQEAGVDRIWVDLEYIGKEERQKGLNTVKSKHTLDDISKLRPYITKATLQVRVNPIHNNSYYEINEVIKRGADIIMLPMFKTVEEAKYFIDTVNGRAKTILLFETSESIKIIDKVLSLPGIDEVYIGLNDLSLSMKKPFMFDPLAEGIVDEIVTKFKKYNYPYGFGGIARIGYGLVPAELIIPEHYRLGSSLVILSRSFCDANVSNDLAQIKVDFEEGIRNIRQREKEVEQFTIEELNKNHNIVVNAVKEVDRRIKAKNG